MLKYLTVTLVLFFALTTLAHAQADGNFPWPSKAGDVHDIPAAYAACLPMVKQMAQGQPMPRLMTACMFSKGYQVNNGFWSCDSIPAEDPVQKTYSTRAQCVAAGRYMLPDGGGYFPMGWERAMPPVAYDPGAPGPRLLLLVKELADSGRSDDPAITASILHLPLTLNQHDETGPASCHSSPDAGGLASDSYAIKGNGWFHALPTGKKLVVDTGLITPASEPLGPPIFSYTVTTTQNCGAYSRVNGVGASIIFDNIPAYACISRGLTGTIFPPGTGDFDGVHGSYGAPSIARTYAVDHTLVEFQLTFQGGYVPPGTKTLDQANCLREISIGSQYSFGQQHKSNFSDQPPVPINVAVSTIAANTSAPAASPGDYLLERVKALAESGHITNPVAASAVLHLPFALSEYAEYRTVSCTEFPNGQNSVSDYYGMATGGWFHALPTGKQLLFTSPVYANDEFHVVGHTTAPSGDPSFVYNSGTTSNCTSPSSDGGFFDITLDNVPSYACISGQQVRSVFASFRPSAPTTAYGLPDFAYSSPTASVAFFLATNTQYPEAAHRTLAPHQPLCVEQIQLYPLGNGPV